MFTEWAGLSAVPETTPGPDSSFYDFPTRDFTFISGREAYFRELNLVLVS